MSQLKHFNFDKEVQYDKNTECLCVSISEIQKKYKKISTKDQKKFKEVIPSFSNWKYYTKEQFDGKIDSIMIIEKFDNCNKNIEFIFSKEKVKIFRNFFSKSEPQVLFTGDNLKKWIEMKNLEVKTIPIEVNKCPCCLSTFENVNYCFLDCGHKFHCTCLIESVLKKNECPICEEIIVEKPKTFFEKYSRFIMAAEVGTATVFGIPMAIIGLTVIIVSTLFSNIYFKFKQIISKMQN